MVMTSVVDDLYDGLVEGIAAGRKKTPEEVRANHRSGTVHVDAGVEGGAGGRA